MTSSRQKEFIMKNIGLKLTGLTVALLLTNIAFATDQPSSSDENVVAPGTRIMQGVQGKNDLYILSRNEQMPAELTAQAKQKANIEITKKKGQLAQQKAIEKPIDVNLPNTTLVATPPTSIGAPAIQPAADITPGTASAIPSPSLTSSQLKPTDSKQAPANSQANTAVNKAGAVTSMTNVKGKKLSSNVSHAPKTKTAKLAAQHKKPKYLQKVASNSSHEAKQHTHGQTSKKITTALNHKNKDAKHKTLTSA